MKFSPLLVAAALALGLSSCTETMTPESPKTIAAVVASDPEFSTLKTALAAAGLTATLEGAGPFTVFAPTNAAFARLPAGTLDTLLKPENKATLTAILTYHVVAGKVPASEIVKLNGQSIKTVNGASISVAVTGTAVKLNGTANVIKTDVAASNGVIHVIDAVLLPPS